MYKKRVGALLCSLLLIPMLAGAQVTINGFASAGGGLFLDDLEEGETVEGSYTDEFNASNFTKFAIQTKAKVNDRTTVTGQFIARGVDDFNVNAEWAYIAYELTNSTEIRMGRMRAPLFMYSDFIDVGYAYPWIRPPLELYRLPFSTVEGIDFINTHSMGNWDGSLQMFYGNLNEDAVLSEQETVVELKDFAGINYVLSNDWLSLRASYNLTEFSVQTPEAAAALFDGFTELSATLAGIGFVDAAAEVDLLADALAIDKEDGQFYGVGFTVDAADWLMAGEFTVLDVGDQSLVSNDETWYFMVGRRFGDVTLHLTVQEQEADPDLTIFEGLAATTTGIPALDGAIAGLAQGAPAAIINEKDTSVTLGVRYDYGASTAFKFEIAQVDQENDDIEGTTVSFSVDVVF